MFDSAGDFSDGRAAVHLKRFEWPTEYKYIDEYGNVVIDNEFIRAEDFQDGLALVAKYETRRIFAYYDESASEFIAPDEYDQQKPAIKSFEPIYEGAGCKIGFINTNGEYVIEDSKHLDAKSFSHGLAAVRVE